MRKLFRNLNDGFICQNCGKNVMPLKWGGHNRNHCPFCLFSFHIDEETPGDRLANCRGLMTPIAIETRRTGEYVLIHKCAVCGKISKNRAAGDDDWEKIISLTNEKK